MNASEPQPEQPAKVFPPFPGGSTPRALAPTARAYLQHALDAFYVNGYNGTSVRDIARAADVNVAVLYHHFKNKHDVLFSIIYNTQQELAAAVRSAVDAAPDDPLSRLDAFVVSHVRFHTAHKAEAFVANSEMRRLEPEAFRFYVGLRRDYEQRLTSIVDAGIASGVFVPDDAEEAVRAILTMTQAIASWFNPHGRLRAEDVAERYRKLARRLLEPT